MIIDYSNLRPGDDAPEPADPATPKPEPAAQGGAHAHSHAAAQAHALTPARANCANVVVLSADPQLVDLLRDALEGVHR
ncbi:MAG: hypothetical protein ACRETY_12780, partial [Steroidobacteraceae bacterium]